MGGPNKYTGKDMRPAHQFVNNGKFFPNKEQLVTVADCWVETLRELDVPNDLIDDVVKIVMSVKADVTSKKPEIKRKVVME